MGKLKKKDPHAAALARKRWAKIPPEKRAAMMPGGRARIYPPCTRYKRHNFNKAGVCKCGFSKAATS